MSFWKPLIDWNASHKYHAANRSEARYGIGVGIWKAASTQESQDATKPGSAAAQPSTAYAAPGDIHGAF